MFQKTLIRSIFFYEEKKMDSSTEQEPKWISILIQKNRRHQLEILSSIQNRHILETVFQISPYYHDEIDEFGLQCIYPSLTIYQVPIRSLIYYLPHVERFFMKSKRCGYLYKKNEDKQQIILINGMHRWTLDVHKYKFFVKLNEMQQYLKQSLS
jgi:hypothetical protein